MKFYMNEIQTPIYLDSNYVWDPKAFSLSNYKERSIFQSNVIEFWAPVTDLVIPGIIPGRYWVSSWGNTWNTARQTVFGLSMHRKGYWQFAFACYNPDGEYFRTTRKLHKVIMKTFCYFPGCENYIVNHKDCNKTNNNLYNLEWCTESENTIHAINNGTKIIFNTGGEVKLTDDDVAKIYELGSAGCGPTEIQQRLHLEDKATINLISNICHKKARIAWFKKNGLL